MWNRWSSLPNCKIAKFCYHKPKATLLSCSMWQARIKMVSHCSVSIGHTVSWVIFRNLTGFLLLIKKLWWSQGRMNDYIPYRTMGVINYLYPNLSSFQWRHNECDGISNHRRLDGLLSSLFRRRSKKTSMLSVTGLREGNSPVTSEFPTQRSSNAENVSTLVKVQQMFMMQYENDFYFTSLKTTFLNTWQMYSRPFSKKRWTKPG